MSYGDSLFDRNRIDTLSYHQQCFVTSMSGLRTLVVSRAHSQRLYWVVDFPGSAMNERVKASVFQLIESGTNNLMSFGNVGQFFSLHVDLTQLRIFFT